MQMLRSLLRMRPLLHHRQKVDMMPDTKTFPKQHRASSLPSPSATPASSSCSVATTGDTTTGSKRFPDRRSFGMAPRPLLLRSNSRLSCLPASHPRAAPLVHYRGSQRPPQSSQHRSLSLSDKNSGSDQQQQGRTSRRPVPPSAAAGSLPFPSDDSNQEGKVPSELIEASDTSEMYKQDLSKIMALAGPLMLQNVFGYLLNVVCTIAIGRLGAPELAASALANSIYVVTGLSMVLGLSTAMETLCGQAYGARDYKTLGVVLQRAMVVCWVACIPVALMWTQSTALMVAAGQDPVIAAMAGRYLVLVIPCLFLNIAQDCMRRYLQAQRIVGPPVFAAVFATLMAPLYFYTLVYGMGLGLDGAAYAFIMSQMTGVAGLLGYIMWHTKKSIGSPTATWGGFSAAAAFSNWGQYLEYGIPAMLMLSLEWWVFEIAVLMNGWLPNAAAALSVGGIVVLLETWCYMIPRGLGSAVNTCVGNALGAGDGQAARRFAIVGLACGFFVEATVVAGVATFGKNMVRLIATDPSIVELASRAIPVLCLLMFWDGMNAVMAGVLRGSGQQKIGALINGLCFVLAIPAAYFCGFVADWSYLAGVPFLGGMDPVARIWLGITTGALAQFFTINFIVSRWDWDAQARRVLKGLKPGPAKQ